MRKIKNELTAQEIIEQLIEQGNSKEWIANEMGVVTETISNWLKGNKVRKVYFEKLESLLEVK